MYVDIRKHVRWGIVVKQQRKSVVNEAERSKRIDVIRNKNAILEAAKAVFANSGVDAPVREIAEAAGVGVGTLYRRFPKRFDLVAAVFRREMDICVDAAVELSSKYPPGDALKRWLMIYTDFVTTKKGLSVALHSGDSAFDGLQEHFKATFEPALYTLLKAASDTGDIRTDIDAYDLLRAIGNMAVGEDGGAHTKRMVLLLADGLQAKK